MMRVELDVPIVLIPGWSTVWHVPSPMRITRAGRRCITEPLRVDTTAPTWPTVCGADGLLYAYRSVVRELPLCGVCRVRAPRDHPRPELGPLPRRKRTAGATT